MPQPFPDPFTNTDPLWEPFQPPQSLEDEFSKPDLTPTTIKTFLRQMAEIAAKHFNANHTPVTPDADRPPINIPKGY
jgi:hypothetical protein